MQRTILAAMADTTESPEFIAIIRAIEAGLRAPTGSLRRRATRVWDALLEAGLSIHPAGPDVAKKLAERIAAFDPKEPAVPPRAPGLYVVFDGPPGATSGHFIEVEDETGRSVRAAEWRNESPYWALGPFGSFRTPAGPIPDVAKESPSGKAIEAAWDPVRRAYSFRPPEGSETEARRADHLSRCAVCRAVEETRRAELDRAATAIHALPELSGAAAQRIWSAIPPTDFVCDRCGKALPGRGPGRDQLPANWTSASFAGNVEGEIDLCGSCGPSLEAFIRSFELVPRG